MKFYSASLVSHFQFYFSFFLCYSISLFNSLPCFEFLLAYWLLEWVYYLVLPSCVLLYYLGICSYDILDISWCRYLFLSLLREFLIFAYFRSVWSLVKYGGCRVASEELFWVRAKWWVWTRDRELLCRGMESCSAAQSRRNEAALEGKAERSD